MAYDYDTVKSAEKREDLSPSIKGIRFNPVPDTNPDKYKKGRIKNYTCPECSELLPEVITVGGKPQGWCGVKHQYVGG